MEYPVGSKIAKSRSNSSKKKNIEKRQHPTVPPDIDRIDDYTSSNETSSICVRRHHVCSSETDGAPPDWRAKYFLKQTHFYSAYLSKHFFYQVEKFLFLVSASILLFYGIG